MTNPFVQDFLESGGKTPEEYAQRVSTFLAGMPCCNRETAAQKAAAHRWMEKERKARAKRWAKRMTRINKLLDQEIEKLKVKGLL